MSFTKIPFIKTVHKLIDYTMIYPEDLAKSNIFKRFSIKFICFIFGIDFETHCYKKTGCLAG